MSRKVKIVLAALVVLALVLFVVANHMVSDDTVGAIALAFWSGGMLVGTVGIASLWDVLTEDTGITIDDEVVIHVQREHGESMAQEIQAIHVVYIFNRDLGLHGARDVFHSGRISVRGIKDAERLTAILSSIVGVNAQILR